MLMAIWRKNPWRRKNNHPNSECNLVATEKKANQQVYDMLLYNISKLAIGHASTRPMSLLSNKMSHSARGFW